MYNVAFEALWDCTCDYGLGKYNLHGYERPLLTWLKCRDDLRVCLPSERTLQTFYWGLEPSRRWTKTRTFLFRKSYPRLFTCLASTDNRGGDSFVFGLISCLVSGRVIMNKHGIYIWLGSHGWAFLMRFMRWTCLNRGCRVSSSVASICSILTLRLRRRSYLRL